MIKLAIIDLAEFIYESDAIEGIKDDPDVLIRQIQAGARTIKESGNQDNWANGHVGAMLTLEQLAQSQLNVPGYVTKELICKIQGLITAEQHKKPGGERLADKYIGKYRDCAIKIGGNRLEPGLVPSSMEKLIGRIMRWQENARFKAWYQNVRVIAGFHLDFELIHPFADGNGRTGRALVYYLMRWGTLKPFVFTSDDKFELYYPCFGNHGNYSLMEKYFFTKMGCPELR